MSLSHFVIFSLRLHSIKYTSRHIFIRKVTMQVSIKCGSLTFQNVSVRLDAKMYACILMTCIEHTCLSMID
jgi:hypothetical protein